MKTLSTHAAILAATLVVSPISYASTYGGALTDYNHSSADTLQYFTPNTSLVTVKATVDLMNFDLPLTMQSAGPNIVMFDPINSGSDTDTWVPNSFDGVGPVYKDIWMEATPIADRRLGPVGGPNIVMFELNLNTKRS